MYRALPEMPDVPSVPIQIKRPGNKCISMQLCVREEAIADVCTYRELFVSFWSNTYMLRGIKNRRMPFPISIDRTWMNHVICDYIDSVWWENWEISIGMRNDEFWSMPDEGRDSMAEGTAKQIRKHAVHELWNCSISSKRQLYLDIVNRIEN